MYTTIQIHIPTRFTYMHYYKTYIHNCIHMYITKYIYLHVYITTDIYTWLQDVYITMKLCLLQKRPVFWSILLIVAAPLYVDTYTYGVATISRMLQIIGLFCKRALQKRPVFCKETFIFKHPTHRSHPITTNFLYNYEIYNFYEISGSVYNFYEISEISSTL